MSNYLFIAAEDPGPRDLGRFFPERSRIVCPQSCKDVTCPFTALIPVLHGWARAQFQALTSASNGVLSFAYLPDTRETRRFSPKFVREDLLSLSNLGAINSVQPRGVRKRYHTPAVTFRREMPVQRHASNSRKVYAEFTRNSRVM
ncbi:hypothetical protein AVEN_182147-1 [Araneus ventricosus]|uniref:Uncharacterized protein n=1 Tax=Araneus ventricosus TaxID=182803 RepID=A0A4Y2GQV3_ARAVE|nr:hypothetical protein AVEN_182147-1 [Araneus ventricosus]